MSLLTRARKGIDQEADARLTYSYRTPLDQYRLGYGDTPSTYAVNSLTVYQCIRTLADAFAQLPLILYRKDGDSRVRADEHPLYRTFHDAPNPAMSSTLWRRIVMGHLATWGNAYNEIERAGNGDIYLWPIRPDRVEVEWAANGESRAYYYTSQAGIRSEIPAVKMFHLQGFGSDGLVGVPPISAMRRAIRLDGKMETYGESVFDNGARPAVILSHPKKLSNEAIGKLAGQMDTMRGSGNAGKTVVLEEGLDVHEIGFPSKDAQYMESRLFERRRIVSGYGLPLSLSGDPEFAAVRVEDKLSELFQWTMPIHFQNFQQEAQLQVIDDPDLYVEFLTDALMWADPKARADALAVQWEHGVINADTWNSKENRPPLPDGIGQKYFVPANWRDVEAEEPQPVGGATSTPTQFGQPAQGIPVNDAPAELVDQLTRAKSLRQFDCPDCGKMVNRLAAPGTVGFCKDCRSEKVMEAA